MTEQEVYKKIRPLFEGYTEGLYWDFKKSLFDIGDIIRDILAFSNSSHEGDSYIIVGINEPFHNNESKKIQLTTENHRRLNADANYLYLPGTWDINGLSTSDIEKMRKISERLTQKLACFMLISQPKCAFYPISIQKNLWLYVIIVKRVPVVFISNRDIFKESNNGKIAVKQGVLYIRIADSNTIGSETKVASATEHIRVWEKNLELLKANDIINNQEIKDE